VKYYKQQTLLIGLISFKAYQVKNIFMVVTDNLITLNINTMMLENTHNNGTQQNIDNKNIVESKQLLNQLFIKRKYINSLFEPYKR
jgi:hypothetical protein